MKHSLFIPLALILLLFSSCERNGEVKDFLMDLGSKMEGQDRAAVEALYPDAAAFAFSACRFERDSMKVVEDKGDEYVVSMGGGREMTVVRLADGTLQVKSSRGFIDIPSADKDLVLRTGWLDARLTDASNGKRLGDEGFRTYMQELVSSKIADKVHVGLVTDKEMSNREVNWFDDEHTDPMMWEYKRRVSIEVVNDLDVDIPSDGYTCTCSVVIEEYDHNETTPLEVATKAIPAHSKVVLEYLYTGEYECIEGTGGFLGASATVALNPGAFDSSAFYTPTGREYEEYVSRGAK